MLVSMHAFIWRQDMRRRNLLATALLLTFGLASHAMAQQAPPQQRQSPQGKPNILFIMGDDIGWMQPSIYHRGLMVGETPNLDRIGRKARSS